MLANCLEVLVRGANWYAWHSSVSEKTCSISHRMERSLWPTFSSFVFETFTTQVTTDNFVMRDTRLSIVDWVCSKTQILLATLRTQNQPRWGRREEGLLCIFLMSNIRLHQLDVQEINVRVPQFYRVRNHSVGCWFENGRATWTWLMGCGDRGASFLEDYRITNPSSSRNLFAKS